MKIDRSTVRLHFNLAYWVAGFIALCALFLCFVVAFQPEWVTYTSTRKLAIILFFMCLVGAGAIVLPILENKRDMFDHLARQWELVSDGVDHETLLTHALAALSRKAGELIQIFTLERDLQGATDEEGKADLKAVEARKKIAKAQYDDRQAAVLALIKELKRNHLDISLPSTYKATAEMDVSVLTADILTKPGD